MFGLGMQELLLIFAIAALFFGGKKIPELAKVILSMRALLPDHRHFDILHSLQRISPLVQARSR